MSEKNVLIKNILRVFAANFWATLVGFACSFIFPAILSIEAYALYHTFTLYVGYIAILHLGFPSGLAVNYAGKDYDKIDNSQFKSEMIVLFLILAVFTGGFGIASFFLKQEMILYIMLAVIPVCIVGSYKALLQSWSKFKEYARINIILATVIPILALTYYFIFHELSGQIYILIYLLIYWVVNIYIIIRLGRKVSNVKSARLFSRQNFDTEKNGFAIAIGSYINTLFVSADKQFVQFFFDSTCFAFYSFGISMQALMTVMITSLAQPFFPEMAKGTFKDNDYIKLKEILLFFGSMSGCAYFACSFIVKLFIKKYIDSLDVIGIYFCVFPAMAIINCLYVNLYKIKRKTKQYVLTLIAMLFLAIVLNILFGLFYGHFSGIAIATSITYYVWLIVGMFQFRFIKFYVKDFVYIMLFLVSFFSITRLENDILGFFVYFVVMVLLFALVYRKNLKTYFKFFKRK